MLSEVRDRLVTALSYLLQSQVGGTARSVVSDGYLAVDNCFSALLLHAKRPQTRDHRQKLRNAIALLGAETDAIDLGDFFELWQKVRYSHETPTPHSAFRFRRVARAVFRASVQFIARSESHSTEELEDEIYAEALGGRWLSFEEPVSEIHDLWQDKLERAGEQGQGSRLMNKLLNPSNYCEVNAFTEDDVT